MNLAENIKTYRKKAGLTQKELAEKTKLSIATIQGYEQEKYLPKAENLRKIAKALGVFDHQIDPSMIKTFNSGVEFEKEWGRLIDETQEKEMLQLMGILNNPGKEEAIRQVKLLTKVPEYQKNNK